MNLNFFARELSTMVLSTLTNERMRATSETKLESARCESRHDSLKQCSTDASKLSHS